MYRSSTGNLGYYDEPPRRSDRWDRERFERYNRGGPDERESFRFEENSHSRGGRGYRDVEVDERIDRRGSRGRVEERDRYYEEDRYSRRRPEFLNEPTPSEVANRALAPYRRKSVVEHEIDVTSRRPTRPMYIRRQSSLDTFDRRPLPRYNEYEHEEWRPPTNVPIPLPIRERRRSPSRSRRYEEDFEEIRYKDVEPSYREEDYRDVRIRREKSTTRRSKSHRGARSDRSSTSSFEEISPVREVGKRGRTRMPRRLVHKQAVIDLGYPFEEEEDFIVVKRALEKEQIDEVIKISENYKDKKVTYHYEEKVEEMAPAVIAEPLPPPPPLELIPLPPPPPSEHHSHHHHHQHHHPHSVRSASPPRTLFEERIDESATIAGPLAALVPGPRSEREITAEILALEAERRRIKTERESEYDFIEVREPRKEIEARREVVRVEKDRKARRRDDSKILGAMVATLT